MTTTRLTCSKVGHQQMARFLLSIQLILLLSETLQSATTILELKLTSDKNFPLIRITLEFAKNLPTQLPHKMLEKELENSMVCPGQSLQQLLDFQQSHVSVRHESDVLQV